MDEEIILDDEVNNFSEEEEAMFVAEESTESESEGGTRRHRSPAPALGNVTAFRRPHLEDGGPAAPPPPGFTWAPHQQFIPQDARVLLLFDLNGVLVHHSFNGHSHKHFLRPGAADLVHLLPHYRLGVYSSATQKTVHRAIAKLHEDLSAALPEGDHPPPGGFFEVVLCRDHCVLAKEIGASRPGGKPWDTVKPLGRYFQDLSRVVLVDDSPHKSLPVEAANMLVMPVWAGPDTPAGQVDGSLSALVEGLLEAAGVGDARPVAAAVSARLFELAPPPETALPPPPPYLLDNDAAAAAATAPTATAGHRNPFPALQALLMTWLGIIQPPPGATLYDINTLLQRRFMTAFTTLFGGSARDSVGRLATADAIVVHRQSQGSVHGTRYALPEDAVVPGPQELADIEEKLTAARSAAQAAEFAAELAELSGSEGEPPAQGADARAPEGAQRQQPSTRGGRRRRGKPRGAPGGGKVLDDPEAEQTLITATLAELATRPGVPRDHVDACLGEELRAVPALAGWFGPAAARDPARRAAEALRMAINRAVDACCAAETVELVGTAVGGTPPPLFHLRLTEKGTAAVAEAGEDVTASAVADMVDELRARRIPSATDAPPPPPLPPPQDPHQPPARQLEFAGGLPGFEDRGEPAAGAVPAAAAPRAAAPAAAALIEQDPSAFAPSLPTEDQPLSKKQRKLANMRAKLGLPADSKHSKAELRSLTLELRRAESGAAKAAAARARTMAVAAAAGTPLHRELAELARRAAPTPAEIAAVEDAVRAVDAAARSVWPEARAVLFGSQATGLALPGGDLDVVILGVGPEIPSAALGFTPSQRKAVAELLEDLLDALRRGGALLTSVELIADAKVPIVKCLLQAQGDKSPALAVDVSFGAGNGAVAVTFLRRQLEAVPPLRPLALAVKALLRDRGLNEVFTGGIGSYAVVNMVLAHLQSEGFTADLDLASDGSPVRKYSLRPRSPMDTHDVLGDDGPGAGGSGKKWKSPGGDHYLRSQSPKRKYDLGDDPMGDTFRFLERLAAEAAADSGASSGGDTVDLGTLLWGFLERFGCEFDFERRAVSIRHGGFVRKGRWKQMRRPWLLAVEDPQDPGKDICAGSFNIKAVQDEFAAAAQTLAELCEDAEANAAAKEAVGSPSGEKVGDLAMLSMLLDVECAVGRGPAAHAARRALDHRAELEREAVKTRKRAAPWAAGGDVLQTWPPRKRYRGEDSGSAGGSAPKRHKNTPPAAPKGRGRGGQGRGSKTARAVEAQWKDRRGQFMDPYEDGPAYFRDQERDGWRGHGGDGGGRPHGGGKFRRQKRGFGGDDGKGPPGVNPPRTKRTKAKTKKKAPKPAKPAKPASAKKGDKGK